MKLTVVDSGYIGLPTSIMFAKYDVDVLGVDINQQTIDKLQSDRISIGEPGLQEIYEEVLSSGKLKVSTTPEVPDVFIIAVPTPNNDDQYRSCDISLVMCALDSILPFLEKGNTIVVEPTVAPKTMDDFVKPVIENLGSTVGEDIYLAHCPKHVLPGKTLEELAHNNRIIGGATKACIEVGRRVYHTFVQGEMIEAGARTAEMSKLMENTYRDVNIALANELTKICNSLNINVLDVIKMVNKHPRVNTHQPGPNVGGHCLAVDSYFITAKDSENVKLIQIGREINNSMPSCVVNTTKQIIKALSGSKVTVFGLTYKGDVDDIRESPAFDIYELLNQELDIEVCAYDPHVELGFVEYDMSHAIKDASLVLILNDHSEFKNLSDSHFDKMRHKVTFDTKNVVKSSLEDVSCYNYDDIFNFIDK